MTIVRKEQKKVACLWHQTQCALWGRITLGTTFQGEGLLAYKLCSASRQNYSEHHEPYRHHQEIVLFCFNQIRFGHSHEIEYWTLDFRTLRSRTEDLGGQLTKPCANKCNKLCKGPAKQSKAKQGGLACGAAIDVPAAPCSATSTRQGRARTWRQSSVLMRTRG